MKAQASVRISAAQACRHFVLHVTKASSKVWHVNRGETVETPTNDEVGKRKEALLLEAFQPVQIWFPDTCRTTFVEECRAQSAKLANDSEEREVLVWMLSVADEDGWEQ